MSHSPQAATYIYGCELKSLNILAGWQDWVCILLVRLLKGDAVQVCALVSIFRTAALKLQQAFAYASSNILPHLQAFRGNAMAADKQGACNA